MSAAEPRSQRLAIFTAAILVAVLVWLVGGGEEPKSTLVRPSTFLLGEGGAKALYLVAEELALQPQRWMRSFKALDEVPHECVFAILAPSLPLDEEEADALLRFAGRGGCVLYSPPVVGGSSVRAPASRDALLRALDLVAPFATDHAVGAHDPAEPFEPARAGSALARSLLADVDDPVHGFGQAFQLPTGADRAARAAGFEDRLEPLLVAAEGAVGAAVVPWGTGTILLLADAAPLTNGRLRESELAPFVLRALALLRERGPILFDELHHGYHEGGGLLAATWRWLRTTATGHALLGVALVGLLALFFAGLRFGSPIPGGRREARSSLEHVEALARAWQRSRAERRPRELLLEGLRLRLGGGDLERILEAAEREPGLAEALGVVRSARIELAASPPRRPAVDAIALARAVDAILATLSPAEPAPRRLAMETRLAGA